MSRSAWAALFWLCLSLSLAFSGGSALGHWLTWLNGIALGISLCIQFQMMEK